MSDAEPQPTNIAAGPSHFDRTLGTAISEVLREGLAQGSDRRSLDAMLEAIGNRLGYTALLVGRHEGDELQIVASHGHDARSLASVRFPVTEGLAGRAFQTQEPAWTHDAAVETNWIDLSGGRNRSGLCLPMRLPDRLWGVLGVEARDPAAFSEQDVALLQPVADTMAWVLETERLREQAQRRASNEARLRRGLEASAAVVTAGLEATELGTVLDRMVREIREQLEYEILSVLLIQADGSLRVAAQYGFPDAAVEHTYSLQHGIIGKVATTGTPYLVEDAVNDPYYDSRHPDARSELCVPLRIAGRVRGVLNAESPVPGRFTEVDRELLVRIADQMSLILHNVELLSSEKETVLRLHELDRLKSRLLTIASHELRTPLTVVMGFAEVLAEHGETLAEDQKREYASAIARQASSLSQMVDQMLVATQIEQGELAIHASVIRLGDVITEALEGGRDEHIEVRPGCGDLRVLADPFRLRQALEHLFDNAIKYAAEAGRIQVDAREVDGTVIVLLRDEGPGIPGYEHERVFQPFHQVGEHGVAGRRGVGLGLAVARDLVTLMGGELKLFSAEGYGATFTVELPAAG